MKILFIDDDQTRNGSTVSLEYLVQGFKEHNYDVYLLTWKINDTFTKILSSYCTIIDGRRWYAPSISLAVYFTTRFSPFSAIGLKTIVKDVLKFFFGFYISYKVIKKLKPEVVYLNEYRVVPAAIAAKFLKVPTITHVRSRFLERRFFIRRWLLARCVLKYCDRLIAITIHEKEQFLPYCRQNDEKRIIVVGEFFPPFSVSIENIRQMRAELHIPEDSKVIVMLGGIRFLKGTLLFLKAAEKLSQKERDVVFMLLGIRDAIYEGESPLYYQECKALIEKLSNTYHNFIGKGDVLNPLDYIAMSDILVSPYIEDHFSRPLIEAWGLKKAIVAVKNTYTSNLVAEGEDGFLVEKEDAETLAQKLSLLLSNATLRKTMGDAGSEKVKRDYDFQKNIERIISVSKDLCQ